MRALADRLGGGEAEQSFAAGRPVPDGAIGRAQDDRADLEGMAEVGDHAEPFLERGIRAL